MAAELDYAFLAEFAKTQDGTLTVVGASFTQVFSASFPASTTLYVAGRVRRQQDDPTPSVGIALSGPQDSTQIEFEAQFEDTADAVRYDGKVATVFVFSGPLLLTESGIYECHISIDGTAVRRLAFEALSPDSP